MHDILLGLLSTIGRLGISELNELRVLRDEDQRPKRLVADLTLDKHLLQEAVAKKSEACAPPQSLAVDLRDVRDDAACVQADAVGAFGVLSELRSGTAVCTEADQQPVPWQGRRSPTTTKLTVHGR